MEHIQIVVYNMLMYITITIAIALLVLACYSYRHERRKSHMWMWTGLMIVAMTWLCIYILELTYPDIAIASMEATGIIRAASTLTLGFILAIHLQLRIQR